MSPGRSSTRAGDIDILEFCSHSSVYNIGYSRDWVITFYVLGYLYLHLYFCANLLALLIVHVPFYMVYITFQLACVFCANVQFLQRVSIACYAERCISYDRFCLTDRLTVWQSDRLTVCPSHAGIMPKRLQLRSCGLHWRIAPWL